MLVGGVVGHQNDPDSVLVYPDYERIEVSEPIVSCSVDTVSIGPTARIVRCGLAGARGIAVGGQDVAARGQQLAQVTIGVGVLGCRLDTVTAKLNRSARSRPSSSTLTTDASGLDAPDLVRSDKL